MLTFDYGQEYRFADLGNRILTHDTLYICVAHQVTAINNFLVLR